MSRLSAVLKDKSQQCQNEHAKSHQVFEIIVLHRHHLDSLREFRQCHPATRSSRKYFIIRKQNIQRTSCEVCRCMFFIFSISLLSYVPAMRINRQQLRRQLALHASCLFLFSITAYMLQAQLAKLNALRCCGSLCSGNTAKDDDVQQAVAHQTVRAMNAAHSLAATNRPGSLVSASLSIRMPPFW